MSALEALAPSYALIARATSPVRTSDHLSDADSDASSDFDIDPDDFLDFLDSESEPEEEATGSRVLHEDLCALVLCRSCTLSSSNSSP